MMTTLMLVIIPCANGLTTDLMDTIGDSVVNRKIFFTGDHHDVTTFAFWGGAAGATERKPERTVRWSATGRLQTLVLSR